MPGSSGFGGVTGTSLVSLDLLGSSFRVSFALFGIVLLTYPLKSAPSFTLAVIARLILLPAKSSNPSVISRVTIEPSILTLTLFVSSAFGTPPTVT